MTAGLWKAASGQSRHLYKDHVLLPPLPSTPLRVWENVGGGGMLCDSGVIFTSPEPASGGETADSGALDMADLHSRENRSLMTCGQKPKNSSREL